MAVSPLSDDDLPPSLRLLKNLVTVLTVTMIVGVIAVVALLVTRLNAVPAGDVTGALPASIHLPDGRSPRAVTFGPDWIAVVTDADTILIYQRDGRLRQQITLAPAP